MSETVEQPQGEPAADPSLTPTPAPESTPAPADAPEQTEEEQQREARGGDRRFAAVTAKLSAAERIQAQQAAELAYWRGQAQGQQQSGQETPEQQQHRMRAEIRSEVEAQIRTETFHAQGAAEFDDWKQRCDELVQMGADANFAQLLVKMPDGVKVAGSLAADPAAVARIAGMRDPDARAVALGKYAATLGNGTARTAAPVPSTRAPAPVRPVTGRAAPVFNEYTASPEALADYYLKSDLEKARARRH